MKIAFDIDGVVTNQSLVELCIIKSNPDWEKIYYETRIPQLDPHMFESEEDELFFITGRKEELMKVTMDWCKKFFPNIKLIFAPTPTWKHESEWAEWFKKVAEHKAKIINDYKIDVYFEDMPETVKSLRILCPNTKIVQYGGRLG